MRSSLLVCCLLVSTTGAAAQDSDLNPSSDTADVSPVPPEPEYPATGEEWLEDYDLTQRQLQADTAEEPIESRGVSDPTGVEEPEEVWFTVEPLSADLDDRDLIGAGSAESNAAALPGWTIYFTEWKGQSSRVSANISKEYFSQARVCSVEFFNVREEDLPHVTVGFMADRHHAADKARSRQVRHRDVFAMWGDSGGERAYYVGRLHFHGRSDGQARQAFFDRNPDAGIRLRIRDANAPGVMLAEHATFDGAAIFIPRGQEVVDLTRFKGLNFNDKASSVKVSPGVRARLYEHRGFAGQRVSVSTDTSSLSNFNDKTSSVRSQ